jgi:PTH1 family peptidyl-tRNA hydrolase
VIAGLGNPGRRYSKTRHNLGFMVLDKLASIYGIKVNKKGFDSHWGEGFIEREKVILTKPQTFMNLSGKAVRSILKGKRMETSDLLILHDDMDIELGKIRIRNRGGSGGHRGLKSIIDVIGTDRFIRIRMGIGRPEDKEEAEAYVLSPFKKSETPIISEAILMAIQASVTVVKDGVIEAMNKYNKRNPENCDLI